MAAMFMTREQVQAALGKSEEEIRQLVASGQLREFRDGPRAMYNAQQVEALRTGGSVLTYAPAAGAAGEKVKVPPHLYVLCGLPLVMIAIGGAIGGGLGGAAYAVSLGVYQKTRSPALAVLTSIAGAGVAFGIWLVIAMAIRK